VAAIETFGSSFMALAISVHAPYPEARYSRKRGLSTAVLERLAKLTILPTSTYAIVNCFGQKECAPLLLLASTNYPRSQFAGGR
jgi:hypothetical protein